MELLNDELKELLKDYPIYSQDGKGSEALIIAKFFNPYGRGSWYVLEGEPIENGTDYRLFGYIKLLDNEYSYFLLSELENLKIPLSIKDENGNIYKMGYGQIERDINFKPLTKLKEVLDN